MGRPCACCGCNCTYKDFKAVAEIEPFFLASLDEEHSFDWTVDEADGSPWNCKGTLQDSLSIPSRSYQLLYNLNTPAPNSASTEPSHSFTGYPPDLNTWYTPAYSGLQCYGFKFSEPLIPDGHERYVVWRWDENNYESHIKIQEYHSKATLPFASPTDFGDTTYLEGNPFGAPVIDEDSFTTNVGVRAFPLDPCVIQDGRYGMFPTNIGSQPYGVPILDNGVWRRFQRGDVNVSHVLWSDPADESAPRWSLDLSDGAPPIYFGLAYGFRPSGGYKTGLKNDYNRAFEVLGPTVYPLYTSVPPGPDDPSRVNWGDKQQLYVWQREFFFDVTREYAINAKIDSVCIKVKRPS